MVVIRGGIIVADDVARTRQTSVQRLDFDFGKGAVNRLRLYVRMVCTFYGTARC